MRVPVDLHKRLLNYILRAFFITDFTISKVKKQWMIPAIEFSEGPRVTSKMVSYKLFIRRFRHWLFGIYSRLKRRCSVPIAEAHGRNRQSDYKKLY